MIADPTLPPPRQQDEDGTQSAPSSQSAPAPQSAPSPATTQATGSQSPNVKVKDKKQTPVWSDQAWLMSNNQYWHIASAYNTRGIVFDQNLQLDSSAIDAFMRLSGAEITLLQPYFKIEKWKEEQGKFVEYPITQLQKSIDDVAKDKGKISYTTIKSIDIKRNERRIGERAIEFTLQFHASSYDAFVKPMGKGAQAVKAGKNGDSIDKGVALVDFIRRAKGLGKVASGNEAKKDPNTTRLADQTVRLTVGLSSPTGKMLNNLDKGGFVRKNNLTVFAGQKQFRQIRLLGTLLEHNVTLNSDGSLGITIKYLGIMDAMFEDPSMNVMFNPKNKTHRTIISKLYKDLKATKDKNERNAIQKDIEATKKTYAQEAAKEVFEQFYRETSIRKVSVAASIINQVTNRKTAAQLEKAGATSNLVRDPVTGEMREPTRAEIESKFAKDAQGGDGTRDPAPTEQSADTSNLFKKIVWNKPPKATAKPVRLNAVGTPLKLTASVPGQGDNVDVTPTEKVGEENFTTRQIYYIPLAAIIRFYVFNALDKGTDKNGKFAGKKPEITIGNIRFSIIEGKNTAGDGRGFFATTSKVYEANIGSIPITIETFQKWYVKYIAGQQKSTFTLRQFLTTLLQGLIAEAFAGFGLASFAPTPYNATLNYYSYKEGTSIMISALNGGTVTDDYAIFKLGGRQAVIKDISFSKANVSKYYGPAQLDKSAYSKTGIVRYPTDVKITMVGNPFFKNGQLIIVDPRGFIPLTTDAGQLGIGGAYRLISTEMKWTPQGYETTITGVFESAYRIPFGKGGEGPKKIFKGSETGAALIDFIDVDRKKFAGT
jgi:hypothetical protein